ALRSSGSSRAQGATPCSAWRVRSICSYTRASRRRSVMASSCWVVLPPERRRTICIIQIHPVPSGGTTVTAHPESDQPRSTSSDAAPSPEAAAPSPSAVPDPPLITPTFVLAWLVNFFQYLLFYLLVTTVALYAVKEFAA